MDQPLADWFLMSVTSSSSSTRTGGVGEVPKEVDADVRLLNQYIIRAIQIAKQRRIPIELSSLVLSEQDLPRVFVVFTLVPDHMSPLPLSELLPPPHLQSQSMQLMKSSFQSKQQASNTLGSILKPLVCTELAMKHEQHKISAKISNLRTLIAGRWLDSVAIDLYIHILQEYFPFKSQLFVHSAQDNPTLSIVAKTPRCYKYVLVPLWKSSHWTVLLVEHNPYTDPVTRRSFRGRIRYINSQVVDESTPDVQTEPFEQVFPNYAVINKRRQTPQQCDNNSCGVYVCFWSMCFLYFSEDQIMSVQCPEIAAFRETMLLQIMIYYLLTPSRRR